MGVVDAIKVGLWPTHLHVSNGLPQRAVVGILRVATIPRSETGSEQNLEGLPPTHTPRAAWLPVPTPNPPQMQMI